MLRTPFEAKSVFECMEVSCSVMEAECASGYEYCDIGRLASCRTASGPSAAFFRLSQRPSDGLYPAGQ